MATMIKTTCPRDCYDACGIHVALNDEGGVRKVLGDPDHHVAKGGLCGKCAIAYNGVWRDPAKRLTSPMKRVGPKGGLKNFEAISWDEALSIVAAKLKTLAGDGKAETVLHAHYTGTVGLIGGWFPLRFFNHYGATEVDPDSVCNKAGHSALEYVFGNSLDGFDPESAKDAAVILVWGANPSHSAPHMHRHWLNETPATIITIDPITHMTATERAESHLQLRPGTDAALAFGFLHVARRDGLLDQAFIDEKVLGFEELAPAITAADPTTTEARTGVPAAEIERVGRLYAKGPSLLWMGQGMQRTTRGGNAFRALIALAAGTGNIGKPGAGTCYMNGPQTRGIDMDVLTAPEIANDPGSVCHMDLAATLADPKQAHAFFTWNCNPLASSPNQGQLRDALVRDDLFTIVCDVFPTDTAAYADILLPAANFLECDDVVAPYFHHTLSAQAKAADAPGEALPNAEIFRRLAKVMGYDAAPLFETDAELIARILAMTPFKGDFAALKAAGTVRLFPEPRLQFADGLATDSGKIEIASAKAEADGLPRIPEPHADAPTPPERLRILSPASIWQMNSSYGNDADVQNKLGVADILLHPDEAKARGVGDGDHVTLSNSAGALTLKVAVSSIAARGFGVVYKGRWPGAEPGAANVNVLHDGQKSDIGDSTCVHSTEVMLKRAEAAE